ncbi:hypothetical protein [Actinoplanes sp. NPDC049118]|uniref:hypothetical protein n=1 Tax=Actinoplanes sp. NPDC049118 TaxID=3155769 RepID=UPI0033CA5605
MLSQGTSPKSRDRVGAGNAPALFECAELVESLRAGELAVALDASGLPLVRSMSADEVVWIASVGVARIGLAEVRARDIRDRRLNLDLLDDVITPETRTARQRRIWSSLSRRKLALGLSLWFGSRHAIAAFRAANGITGGAAAPSVDSLAVAA